VREVRDTELADESPAVKSFGSLASSLAASLAIREVNCADRLVTRGRGIYLMRIPVDDVRIEQGGAVVCMHKKPSADPGVNTKSR
jgi:anti-sigma regulatory factor (Ser/Thr protein kinase)